MRYSTAPGDQGLDELFEKYRQAPDSYLFVPLADACRKQGRLDEALEICENGVKRHPNYPSGYVVKGKCLYDSGDFDTACDTFEHVLELDDNNLVALKFLGMMAADAGQLDAARGFFQKILAIDPDNRDIKHVLRDVDERERMIGSDEVLVAAVVDVLEEVIPAERHDAVLGTNQTDERPENDIDTAPAGEDQSVPEPEDNGSVETSEELASITLADIFAAQGYTSKAEKIYREVLNKQPGNENVRKKLEELGAAAGRETAQDSEDSGRNAEVWDGFDEETHAADEQPGERGGIRADQAAGDGDHTQDRVIEVDLESDAAAEEQFVEMSAAPEMERSDMSLSGENAWTGKSNDEAHRPSIGESDSLNHFRQWLKKMKK